MFIIAVVFITIVSFLWALYSLKKAQKVALKEKQKESEKREGGVVFQAQKDSSSSSLKPDPTE